MVLNRGPSIAGLTMDENDESMKQRSGKRECGSIRPEPGTSVARSEIGVGIGLDTQRRSDVRLSPGRVVGLKSRSQVALLLSDVLSAIMARADQLGDGH